MLDLLYVLFCSSWSGGAAVGRRRLPTAAASLMGKQEENQKC